MRLIAVFGGHIVINGEADVRHDGATWGGKESDMEQRAEDDRAVAEQTGLETEARR
jgi:hypothetical protein